ncbi:RING finger 151-like, partial [Paramuricea clavata]
MASKLAVYNTGYEDERFQQIVSQSFHCIICTNVIRDPVMCRQNEHIFCRACITRHLMNFQTCPTCMEPLTVETLSQAPRGIRNLLAELKIRCEFFDRGCGKFIELGDLERHVTECGFAPAVCSNKGCQLEVNKQDLVHHETAVCELRRVECHNCNDIRQEMDTVKVNLAAMNEKLDRNEKNVLEKIEKNFERVEENLKRNEENVKVDVKNVIAKVELVQEQLNKQEESNRQLKADNAEMKKSLNEITKQLERMTQQTLHNVQAKPVKPGKKGIAEADRMDREPK